jgi:TolA-binding protein
MSNLKRWPDDGAPPDVALLLSAGKQECPNYAGFQRALMAVGVTSAASTAASATSAASTVAGGALGAGGKAATHGLVGLIAKWSALGALSAGVMVGVVSGVQHYQTANATQAATSAGVPAMDPLRGKSEQISAQLTEPQPQASASTPLPESTSSSMRSSRAAPGFTSASGVVPLDRAMAQEIGLIDQARAALRNGNAPATLQAVNDYSRRFPAGRFAPEALYLKMEAYVKSGDPQAASVTARRIIDKYPQGPQVGRAKEVLGSSSNQLIPDSL